MHKQIFVLAFALGSGCMSASSGADRPRAHADAEISDEGHEDDTESRIDVSPEVTSDEVQVPGTGSTPPFEDADSLPETGLGDTNGEPCIDVTPHTVDFGAEFIGQRTQTEIVITSCGNGAIEISTLDLAPDGSPGFALALAGAPESSTNVEPTDPPIVLLPNTALTVTIAYIPQSVSPLDGDHHPISDVGALRIRSNASPIDVGLRGYGVGSECPIAVITTDESNEDIPQTKVHLHGLHSSSLNGDIVAYEWEVEQPEGSLSSFVPSPSAADPTFDLNVVGDYTFRLTVTDASGIRSCVPAEYTVTVTPSEAIHIELLWRTPGDADESDDRGSDLDLHFQHPFAKQPNGSDYDGDGVPDGWFNSRYDCFWQNPHPDWGSPNAGVDDPRLDREDSDGAGPENLNLSAPEDGKTYKVGVHYWDDFGLGHAYADVRIYVYASLVFRVDNIELAAYDFWTVAELTWPPTEMPHTVRVCNGTMSSCTSNDDCTNAAECGFWIVHDYGPPWPP